MSAKKKTQQPAQPTQTIAKSSLTVADKEYIENHGEMSLDELANNLGKSVEDITEYCKASMKKVKTKASLDLYDRPAKGVISMNSASSSSDSSYSKYELDAAIQKALDDEDYNALKNLKEIKRQRMQETQSKVRDKCRPFVHNIVPLGDDDD